MNSNNKCAGIEMTLEMDGLLKQEDIDNRHYLMGQCLNCKEWAQWDKRVGRWQCVKCGGFKYDMRGARSIRTWLVTKHLKTTKTKKRNKELDITL